MVTTFISSDPEKKPSNCGYISTQHPCCAWALSQAKMPGFCYELQIQILHNWLTLVLDRLLGLVFAKWDIFHPQPRINGLEGIPVSPPKQVSKPSPLWFPIENMRKPSSKLEPLRASASAEVLASLSATRRGARMFWSDVLATTFWMIPMIPKKSKETVLSKIHLWMI